MIAGFLSGTVRMLLSKEEEEEEDVPHCVTVTNGRKVVGATIQMSSDWNQTREAGGSRHPSSEASEQKHIHTSVCRDKTRASETLEHLKRHMKKEGKRE